MTFAFGESLRARPPWAWLQPRSGVLECLRPRLQLLLKLKISLLRDGLQNSRRLVGPMSQMLYPQLSD